MISVRASGKPPAGRMITNCVLIFFWASYVIYLYNIHWLLHIHCLSLSAYICPMPVTIGVYLSNGCHYGRIFVQCLSLSAYICPMPVTIRNIFAMPVTIGVYLPIACNDRRTFVEFLSLSVYIFSLPFTIGVCLSNYCHYRRIFV